MVNLLIANWKFPWIAPLRATEKTTLMNIGFILLVMAVDICLWMLLAQTLAENALPEGGKSSGWTMGLFNWLVLSAPAILIGVFPAVVQLAYKPILILICFAAKKERAARIFRISFFVACVLNVLFIALAFIGLFIG